MNTTDIACLIVLFITFMTVIFYHTYCLSYVVQRLWGRSGDRKECSINVFIIIIISIIGMLYKNMFLAKLNVMCDPTRSKGCTTGLSTDSLLSLIKHQQITFTLLEHCILSAMPVVKHCTGHYLLNIHHLNNMI